MTISSIMQSSIIRLRISLPVCAVVLATSFLARTILTVFVPQMAAAATINLYVSSTGSDSNPGTKAAPFRTLQKAAGVATAGVTIHVAPGSYSDTTYCLIPGVVNGTTAVCMQTSGTASAPITFISDTEWGATLTCRSDNAFFILAASHIIVSGFDMTCPGSSYGFAGGTYGNNGYNTFSDNYIHDMAVDACISTGILFGSDTTNAAWTSSGHNVFDRNVIHHGGAVTIGQPTCNQFHGIYTGSPYDVITNNVFSGIVGYGISSYGGGVCYQTIANNTSFDNSQGGFVIEDKISGGYADICANGGKTDYETITNNISVNNGYGKAYSGNDYSGEGGGIALYSYNGNVGTNNIIANNVVFGNNNFQTFAASPAVVVNTITGTNVSVFSNYQSDKNWAPASSYNFSSYAEKSESPSIDAGIAAGAPNHDVINTTRPQGSAYDIGAFEYVSAGDTQAPTVPTNLSGTAISSPHQSHLDCKHRHRRRHGLQSIPQRHTGRNVRNRFLL